MTICENGWLSRPSEHIASVCRTEAGERVLDQDGHACMASAETCRNSFSVVRLAALIVPQASIRGLNMFLQPKAVVGSNGVFEIRDVRCRLAQSTVDSAQGR
jgi:hypothetical protein